MCFRKTSCGFQVLIGLSGFTFVVSSFLVTFFWIYLSSHQSHQFYVLGYKDEFVVPFPKLLCKSITLEKEESGSSNACIMQLRRPTEGNVHHVYYKSSFNFGQKKVFYLPQNLRPLATTPGFSFDGEREDNNEDNEYSYSVSLSVNDPSAEYFVQEFDGYVSNEAIITSSSNTHMISSGKGFQMAREGSNNSNIVLVITTYENKSLLNLDVDVSMSKYNQILGEDIDCSNPPPHVAVFCSGVAEEEEDICTAPMSFHHFDYFSTDKWTLVTPTYLVSDADNLENWSTWKISCNVRSDLLIGVLSGQFVVLLILIALATICYPSKGNPY